MPEKTKPQPQKLRGFTLIEMIVVIGIIAILASIMSIAISIYVRESRIDDANAQAYVVYSTVQDWLIDMEVKNVDLLLFCDTFSVNGGDYYFEIASRNAIEPASAGGNLTVSLGNRNPLSATVVYWLESQLGTYSYNMANNKNMTTNGPIIKEWFGKLGNSFPTGFDGTWRAIINASDYSVFMVYWQDGKIAEAEGTPSQMPTGYRIFDRGVTPQNQYLMPGHTMGSSDGYGFTMAQQQNNVIADNRNLYGQYPFGPIKP